MDQLVDVIVSHYLLSFMEHYSGYNHVMMGEKYESHMTFSLNIDIYYYTHDVVWAFQNGCRLSKDDQQVISAMIRDTRGVF